MKYSVTYPERLRHICIKNGWFSSGDALKFEKVLFCNENGFNLLQISAIIQAYTEGVPHSSIYSALRRERELYLHSLSSDVVTFWF